MGHQFAGPAAAAALIGCLLFAGCGGDESSEPPPVLENARAVVDEAAETVETADGEPRTTASATADDPATQVDELPPPDLSTYEGANRVVNLLAGGSGETRPVDVWGRRTFTNGPILLAENVQFGTASDYFAAPPGYSLVVVGSGAGPDGTELAGVVNAAAGEQITTIVTNDDPAGTVFAPNLWEREPTTIDRAPEPPAEGSGLVVMFAPNVRSFSETLTESVGGDAFYVGAGGDTCARQRIEDDGLQARLLGGTQRVELELPPGPVSLSLHPWLSPDACAAPSVFTIDIDVVADATSLVLVYSPDGVALDALVLPVGGP